MIVKKYISIEAEGDNYITDKQHNYAFKRTNTSEQYLDNFEEISKEEGEKILEKHGLNTNV